MDGPCMSSPWGPHSNKSDRGLLSDTLIEEEGGIPKEDMCKRA